LRYSSSCCCCWWWALLLSIFTISAFSRSSRKLRRFVCLAYRTPPERWRMNEREVLFSWRQRLYLPFHLCAQLFTLERLSWRPRESNKKGAN
jgi:hypothetical protein